MKEVLDKLTERFGDAVVEQGSFRGDEYAVIKRENIIEVCRFLKEDKKLKFEMLKELCGVDYLGRAERFEVIYHLYSLKYGQHLRLKVRLKEEDPVVASVCSLYAAANWPEREAYDLYGIRFEGHPHLKRLLTYEGFKGHALRKDYPKDRRQHVPTSDPLTD